MTEIPKIARQRMQRQKLGADIHPDPDLLTAFAEQALPNRERDQVLAHMAQCADCREVVAMASAAIPAQELVGAERAGRKAIAEEASKSFWAWKPLRWSAAAATAVVVLSAVWLNRPQLNRSQETVLVAPESPATVQVRDQAAVGAPPRSTDELSDTSGAPKTAPQLTPKSESNVANLESQLKLKNAKPPASPPLLSGAAEQVNVSADAATVASESRQELPNRIDKDGTKELPLNGRNFAQLTQLQSGVAKKQETTEAKGSIGGPVAATPARDKNELQVGTVSKPLEPANAPPASPQTTMAYSRKSAGELAPATSVAENKAANAQASAGALQRAAADDALAASSTNELQKLGAKQNAEMDVRSRKPDVFAPWWRVTQDGKLQQSTDSGHAWQTVLGERVGKFHAVASLSSTVWAGGDDGAFWSSIDGGQTWRREVPNVDGHSPKGDVVKIELPNSTTVTIRTSAGEIWNTTNGGVNWTVKYE